MWKNECRQMFPVVGSGRYVTAPIINEDGEPTKDPLVLQQINPVLGSILNSQSNGLSGDASENLESAQIYAKRVLDKKEIEWKLTLHQIGQFIFSTIL